MAQTLSIYTLLFSYLIKYRLMTHNGYGQGGQDWPEDSCNPSINKIASPININTKNAKCSNEYFIDMMVSDDENQPFRIAFVGEPRTLRIRFGYKAFDIFVQFNNRRIFGYRLKELDFRTPSEHTIDGQRSPGEPQYTFVLHKRFRPYTDIHEIRLSFLFDVVDGTDMPNFFHLLIGKLKEIPYTSMLNTTEVNPIHTSAVGSSSLNTYFTRPIQFWAYNGTATDGNCNEKLLRIIYKEKLIINRDDLTFYQNYLKNLTGIETNARTVMNPNEIAVYSCGTDCDDLLSDYMSFFLVYIILIYFLYYLI